MTNTCDATQSRRAGLQAKRNLQSQSSRSAPCRNPKQGAKRKHEVAESTDTATPSHNSLSQLLGEKSVMSDIAEHLMAYTQRNVSYEVQKAIAMTTAIAKWGCNIGDAASRAADCCGFSTETVRQWAFAYITTTPVSSEDDITDDYISDQLSTNCGHYENHTVSLVHDERFQLAARSFVCKHACRKGEPNRLGL